MENPWELLDKYTASYILALAVRREDGSRDLMTWRAIGMCCQSWREILKNVPIHDHPFRRNPDFVRIAPIGICPNLAPFCMLVDCARCDRISQFRIILDEVFARDNACAEMAREDVRANIGDIVSLLVRKSNGHIFAHEIMRFDNLCSDFVGVIRDRGESLKWSSAIFRELLDAHYNRPINWRMIDAIFTGHYLRIDHDMHIGNAMSILHALGIDVTALGDDKNILDIGLTLMIQYIAAKHREYLANASIKDVDASHWGQVLAQSEPEMITIIREQLISMRDIPRASSTVSDVEALCQLIRENFDKIIEQVPEVDKPSTSSMDQLDNFLLRAINWRDLTDDEQIDLIAHLYSLVVNRYDEEQDKREYDRKAEIALKIATDILANLALDEENIVICQEYWYYYNCIAVAQWRIDELLRESIWSSHVPLTLHHSAGLDSPSHVLLRAIIANQLTPYEFEIGLIKLMPYLKQHDLRSLISSLQYEWNNLPWSYQFLKILARHMREMRRGYMVRMSAGELCPISRELLFAHMMALFS